jgi:acetyl esterase
MTLKESTSSYELDIEDVEYIRHGDRPLLARLFKPRGTGPFPLIIQLHGGAWCRGDRLNDTLINEQLAKSGLVVAALDFRMPPEAPYPASLVDINYAIRWLKARAAQMRGRPDRVGILGSSSGGHQAMLAAMRPHDPRYSAALLPSGTVPVDASVSAIVLCWPVIDPLGRYQYAKELIESGKGYPVEGVLNSHHQYWQTEEAMAEGSPLRAMQRGERVDLPPVLYIQGTLDVVHPRTQLEEFVMQYRKAGGRITLELFEGESQAFITTNRSSVAAVRAVEKIIEFFHTEMR